VHEQAGVVVEEREPASAAAALDARVRHEGPDQDLTDPDLVRPTGLEAAEGPGLGGELGAVQAPALKLLAERALGDADAVTGAQDLGDVGGRALRPLPAQGGGFLEELGMAADHAGVRTHLRHPAGQPAGPGVTHPALQRVPTDRAHTPVRELVLAAAHLAHQPSPLSRSPSGVEGLGDQPVAEQRDPLPLGFGVRLLRRPGSSFLSIQAARPAAF
jgi:hypothetical protein